MTYGMCCLMGQVLACTWSRSYMRNRNLMLRTVETSDISFFHEMNIKDITVVLLVLLMLITSCDSVTNRKPFIDDSINIVIKVPEGTAVGTSILNITATDQENDPITFGLDDVGGTVFNIRNVNTKVGELTLKKELNRESVRSYDFHVTVTDGGDNRTTSKQFILDVLDVNDNKPVFVQQPYWTSIPENTTVGTTLLTIQATDADLGTNAVVTYRFSNDSNSAQDNPLATLWKTSKFAIDNLHGTITLASSLDYETTTRYLVPVVAEDGGNPRLQSTTTVVIDVTDTSDNPPKFEQCVYLKEIEENTPVGTKVLSVVAKDGDAGINNPLKYEIYSGNDGTFAIGSSTGVITVNNTIDAEKTQSYKLYVRASEVPNPSSNATVSVLITVIDKNDNPPVFSQDSYSITLRESVAKPGRIVTDELIVRDADRKPEFRRLTYHLTGRDSDKFKIDPSSGELQINSTLDYETQVNYTFTVVVTETATAEKYSDNATLHLTLINENDNEPIFANPSYYYTFDEEIPPGKEIAVITATDADLGSFGQVTYELRGSQSSFFAVDSNTGNITAAKTLDYEEVHSYQFNLIASDGGGISKEITINVTLRDVNDNNPVFSGTPYTSQITENLAAGAIAVKVTVSDKDSKENGKVSLSITSGNIDNSFTINATGYITTTKSLDRETTALYTLTINASDHGNPPRSVTTKVTVDVVDENDNTPYITLGSYIVKNISESAGGGTTLFDSLKAIDGDAGSNGRITYSMSGGDGRFILNSKTGRLQISPTGLDREIKSSYDLVINVTDEGSPPRQNSTTVHVNILDTNDNQPVFDPKPSEASSAYIIRIDEGPSTLNTVIIEVNATDQDEGLNGKIIYSLTGDEHGFFSLDNTTGKLTVVKELDREDPKMPKDASSNGRFLLDVTATDQAQPVSDRKSATVRVTIKVIDINDNSPKFQKRSYDEHVSEAARTGSNVIQVSTEDKDLELAGKVIYNITNGDPSGTFGISENGYIFIAKTLDAEGISLYNLTVLAQDKGSPPLTSTAFAVIRVDDVNDNDPKFNQSTYTALVMENSATGTSVLTVYASDQDKGSNGNVTYKISSGNQNNAFQIDAVTGVISTAASIDREAIQRYILTVQAEDQGQPSTRKDFTEVTITVDDENDNSPQFTGSPYSANIKENSPPGKTLALAKEIHATDADTGMYGRITYSLKGLGAENFNINASTGIITTSNNSSLDREQNASYSLDVIATDGGNKNATAPLAISITDVNDEPPRFAQAIYYTNISEDASQGDTVGKVTATDLDTGINGQIIYTSTGADGKFYVSRSTGNIIVDSSLNRELKSSYILNITAANIVAPHFEGHTQVHITVTDVIDDKPYFSTATLRVSLPENASVGTNVTRIMALDKDVGDSVSYVIADGDINEQFRIDNITGDIFTTKSLDRENKAKHTLLVQARDSKGLVSENNVKVEINVIDVNDNSPVFTQREYIVDYREQSPKDTSILKITATDADSGVNAQIRYGIVENVTSQISVDPITGLISQEVVELDRELQPQFNFTVEATDQGIPSRTTLAHVSLVLVDINDNSPKFANDTYHAEVKENQPIGTPVFVASATDDDTGSNAKLLYALSGSSRLIFKIDPDKGNMSTSELLDRETVNRYTVTLRVVDGAIRPREGSASLIVTVLDVNDHAPVFNQERYSFAVDENVPSGNLVGTVSSTDKDIDENARVSYFITAGNEMNLFAINNSSGKITTISSPDREINDTFSLIITARDHGVPPMESNTTVTITINDVNDNKPVFSQQVYTISLKESVQPGPVVTVSATDADIGVNGQFTFKITAGDDDRLFSINDQTGVVSLQGRLDYETKPLINLTVTATDRGNTPLKGSAFVIIQVTDVDDNAPQFTKDEYKADVYENITQGSFVVQVNATDIDTDEAHKTIFYRIESGNIGDMFAIGKLNGTVYLKCGSSGCLDRETKDNYELTLAAISIVNNTEQKSTVKLTITVHDVNDVTPAFVPSSYTKTVPEDIGDITGRDNTILTISTTDGDIGVNSKVIYSIVKGNEQGFFYLNNKTGVLTKVKPLDREDTSFFQLVVVATDQGVPPLSSNTTVAITVEDVNDNHPSFESTPDDFRVKENITVGTFITIVNATDQDEGTNAYVEYFIISGNEDGALDLNKTSGELKTAKELDHETTPKYKLVIKAENVKSNPKLTETKDINILVTDLNDNRPLFSKSSTTLSVGENLPVGTIVGKIEASDSDKSDRVYYYIIGSSGRDVFDLNETSGIVTTKKIIDREQTPSISMLVKASNYKLDSSSLLRARKRTSVNSANTTNSPLPTDPTTQSVVVEVGDDNDNGPIFTKKVYTGGVSQDIKYGGSVIRIIANDADIGSGGRITYNFSETADDSKKFTINNETGWIKAADSFAGQRGKEYILSVFAKDNFGRDPYHYDTATVKIYVLVDDERVILISGRKLEDVRKNRNEFIRVLQNITGLIINIDDINHYKENEQYDYSRTALYFHGVDPKTRRIVDRDEVIRRINENYQKRANNKAFFDEWKIKEIKNYTPTTTEKPKNNYFSIETLLSVLVGILLLIIVIIVACGIYCFRRMKRENSRRPDTRQAADEESFRMQEAPFYSAISAVNGQQTVFQNLNREGSADETDEIVITRPKLRLTENEPQYADLDPFTTLPSTFYHSLSPSSRNISHAQVKDTNSSSDEPLNYEKFNVPQVYEKRIDLNDQ